jgi:hypothetical protein
MPLGKRDRYKRGKIGRSTLSSRFQRGFLSKSELMEAAVAWISLMEAAVAWISVTGVKRVAEGLAQNSTLLPAASRFRKSGEAATPSAQPLG